MSDAQPNISVMQYSLGYKIKIYINMYGFLDLLTSFYSKLVTGQSLNGFIMDLDIHYDMC